jgi:hypothetical protein
MNLLLSGVLAGVICGLVAMSKQETHVKVTVVVFVFGFYALGVGATTEPPSVGNPVQEGQEFFHNVEGIFSTPAFYVGLLGIAAGWVAVWLVKMISERLGSGLKPKQ